MTDSVWLWSLPAVADDRAGSDAHRRFVANTLRFLSRDPALSRVQVTAKTPDTTQPHNAVIEVRVFDAGYQGLGGAAVDATIIRTDAPDAPTPALHGETASDGRVRFAVDVKNAGVYRVSISAQSTGLPIGSAEDSFVVENASLEQRFVEAQPALLDAIAASSVGGKSVLASDLAEVTSLPFIDRGRERVLRQETEPVWDRAWVLLFAATLWALEWAWRRHHGFA
jgi:hypothetical protein